MADDVGELGRGRQAFADHAWTDAYESLAAAERSNRLGAEDLELLAITAYMLGREEDYLRLLEDVVTEIAATRVTERGETRADDRASEAAMEDRKRVGYF